MQPKTTQSLIYSFLKRAGKPVPTSEVIDHVLTIKRYEGKTPRKTVSSIIQKDKRIKRRAGTCTAT